MKQKQTLRYHDKNYFEECFNSKLTVEGFDYPYICQKCGRFLSTKATNYCGDVDFIIIDGVRYTWLCEKDLELKP